MKNITRLGLFSALAIAMAVTPLAACGTGAYYVDNGDVWVDRAPPPPRFERRPVMPAPNYSWVGGYWYWTGSGYVWRSGFWDRAPQVGHVWVNSGWVFSNNRYRYVAGRWSAPVRAPHHNYVTRPLPASYRPTRPGQNNWRNNGNRNNGNRGNANHGNRNNNRNKDKDRRPAPRDNGPNRPAPMR